MTLEIQSKNHHTKSGTGSTNKMLICEKNKFFRDTLSQIIKSRFPRVDIKWVVSSSECLTETQNFRPDILMLGSNIYTCHNDLDLIDRLRERFPKVNIIFFTDYGIEEYRKEATLRGANHFISKELWSGNEILALLKTIFETKEKHVDKGDDVDTTRDEYFLKHPFERRKKDSKGRTSKRGYLIQYPERRRNDKG